ncbi:hypothetical protein QWY15_10695 [Planococcus sp. N064]|uniref:Uncharacterized protein n=1 Tax=Planococcus liqunii TaxID=3058394 RepID=A0ABT8MS66_9BACL|nr:hypothetical protein [Planococcus sp. N064]MDN7227765.1 hypothetical protein [Planococcus sp. N064]
MPSFIRLHTPLSFTGERRFLFGKTADVPAEENQSGTEAGKQRRWGNGIL